MQRPGRDTHFDPELQAFAACFAWLLRDGGGVVEVLQRTCDLLAEASPERQLVLAIDRALRAHAAGQVIEEALREATNGVGYPPVSLYIEALLAALQPDTAHESLDLARWIALS